MRDRHYPEEPYYVRRSPSGAVVVCSEHLVTEEIKPSKAYAIAAALNAKHKKRSA
ncbi:hypothetical protein J2R95_003140 [Bradyrhizobium japonicum]|jgi:hypothetical protein|nr:hypothetical protein [Bradyrhizobium japonicum]